MPFAFTSPRSQDTFSLAEAVEFNGTLDPPVTRVELVTAGPLPFVLPAVTVADSTWFVAHRFSAMGAQRVVAHGFDAADRRVASAEVAIVIEPPDFGRLVKIPSGINQGLTAAKQRTMVRVFGRPGALSEDCTPVTNESLRARLVRKSVGPFVVEGFGPAVEALARIFAEVQQAEPELFAQLRTAGMLCCRRVRRRAGQPPSPNFSNHAWGTAIDMQIKGKPLDPVGDRRTQLGLLLLHPFFHAEQFFWGAGFSGTQEDSMHFEASDELVKKWEADGLTG